MSRPAQRPARTLVPLGPDRLEDVFQVDGQAFISARDPEVEKGLPISFPWDRAVGVEDDDGRLVAFHCSYPAVLPLPGGSARAAALTWVSVRPDSRRQGLLRTMITGHLGHARQRGEAFSILFAAEPAIYGRFGYGSAADQLSLTMPRGAALRPVEGSDAHTVRFEPVDLERDLETLVALEAEQDAAAPRPGRARMTSTDVWARICYDPVQQREGAEPLHLLTVRRDGRVRGAALVRRKAVWEDSVARGTVDVLLFWTLDPASAHRTWSFLLDLDLTSTVRVPAVPVDDPLLSLLIDVRGTRPRLTDNIWARVVDVPAALGSRRLDAPLDVVLDVTDELLPHNAGRWRLRTVERAAHDTAPGWAVEVGPAADARPDLALDVATLGSVVLGGRSLSALAGGGLVTEHSPGALHATSAALGWPVAPCCAWDF